MDYTNLYLAFAAGLGTGIGITSACYIFLLREQLMELQDRLAELISCGPDDDDGDGDPELRDLLPIDPSAKVPKRVGPKIGGES